MALSSWIISQFELNGFFLVFFHSCLSGQDVIDHQVHVWQLRQYLPSESSLFLSHHSLCLQWMSWFIISHLFSGHNRNRFPVKNHVPWRQNSKFVSSATNVRGFSCVGWSCCAYLFFYGLVILWSGYCSLWTVRIFTECLLLQLKSSPSPSYPSIYLSSHFF